MSVTAMRIRSPVRRRPSRGGGGCSAACSTAATSIAAPRRGRGSAWRSSPSPPSIAIIAVRLVMFAVVSDSHIAHRVVSGDAIATARPDILDRNGEVLATDVRVPSLYAEPRRLIDVDEAVELLTADLPDLDATELRERLSSQARLRLAQARHHAGAAARDLPSRPAGHRLPEREQARLSERRRSLASARPRQYRQPGHRRHREMARRPRPRRAAHGGARHRPAANAGAARRRSARAARAARRTGQGARQIPRHRRRRSSCSTSAPAKSSPWCRSRITTRTIRTMRSIRPASIG